MSFLLDTNLISELLRPRVNGGVEHWFSKVDQAHCHLSVVTWAELRRGTERLPRGERRLRLQAWLESELAGRFAGRILPVSVAIADAWGVLVARREASGRPIDVMDALLAATALVHELTLVTRNTKDFEGSVPDLVNPWE